MDTLTRQFVRRRAGERCEYCHLPQVFHEERFSIDHVTPRKHGGGETPSNLAFACLRCNLCKGTNLTGIDPDTGQVVALFNPRTQDWQQHFRWNGAVLVGQSMEGRVTVLVLRMNAPERVQLRRAILDDNPQSLG
jgi:hypothetical protein